VQEELSRVIDLHTGGEDMGRVSVRGKNKRLQKERLFLYRGPFREKNYSIPAAARVFSLDAFFDLLATASASALVLFPALRSALVVRVV